MAVYRSVLLYGSEMFVDRYAKTFGVWKPCICSIGRIWWEIFVTKSEVTRKMRRPSAHFLGEPLDFAKLR